MNAEGERSECYSIGDGPAGHIILDVPGAASYGMEDGAAALPVGWVSLSGAPLKGGRVTRFIYVDDAGVSRGEPRFVVAGFVIDVDRRSMEIERRLFGIAKDICPHKPNVVLHAADLWHGSGDFPRKDFDQEKRRAAVKRIAALPAEFGLPIVVGQCLKASIPELGNPPSAPPKLHQRTKEAWPHVCAQSDCSGRADLWLRMHCPKEVAQLVHEDIPRSKEILRWWHNILRDTQVAGQMLPMHLHVSENAFPYTNIKGPIFYAGKREERLLQLADTCAFAITRHLNGHADIAPVVEVLRPSIIDWEQIKREG